MAEVETSGHLSVEGAQIAWRRLEGRGPTLVWCGGTRSDMTATKASALAAWAARESRAMLRFDYFGHGMSSGRFEDGCIGRWRGDALAVIDALSAGPMVLVGSSMGGWIAALAALARPQRVAGLVLVAPAPDYTDKLVEAAMTDAQRMALAYNGAFTDGEGETYTQAFLDDGRRWSLLPGPVAITAPVRVLHGGAYPVVPWRHALAFAEALEGPDVAFTLIRDGDHRLSRPQDLARMIAAVEEVCGLTKAGRMG